MASLQGLELNSAAAVRDVFEQAAAANLETSTRQGSVVELGGDGRLLITGDLHDHRENLEKILKLAQVHEDGNHLLMQEVIHGENLINNVDMSYRLLVRLAELKVARPEQVHHILSNHELAQIDGDGIVKEGVSVVEAFDRGLEWVFGEDAEAVAETIAAYVRSLPVAVRCANGVFCAHSLPAPRKMANFDAALLDRALDDEDRQSPNGHAYLMVWGRSLTQKAADELAERWNVKQFVLGHQHAEMGYEEIGDTILILNSDHAHGVALPIELDKTYTRDELIEQLIPLAAVI